MQSLNVVSYDVSSYTHLNDWEVVEEIDNLDPSQENMLVSWDIDVEPSTLYWMNIDDDYGDGIFGWITVTNNVPSEEFAEGTVVYSGLGSKFRYDLDIYIWVDENGESHPTLFVFGLGYILYEVVVPVGSSSGFSLLEEINGIVSPQQKPKRKGDGMLEPFD